MQMRYFNAVWTDVKESPGWFGKFALLALLNIIPIFGQIVSYGYLWGWARDIAWGVHKPLPARIFGNEDGKLFRRGFFVLVIGFVFSLVPVVISWIGSAMQAADVAGLASRDLMAPGMASPFGGVGVAIGGLLSLVGGLLGIVVGVFSWVANMRANIYDRLSAGFQFEKIWKMIAFDPKGILKIFGMTLILGCIIGIIVSLFIGIFIFGAIFTASAVGVGAVGANGADGFGALIGAILAGGGIAILFALVFFYFVAILGMFATALTARAVGYWTGQFQVAQWRGQDDPMPFEVAGAARAASNQPPVQPGAGAVPPSAYPNQQPGMYNHSNAYQQGQPQQGYSGEQQGGAAGFSQGAYGQQPAGSVPSQPPAAAPQTGYAAVDAQGAPGQQPSTPAGTQTGYAQQASSAFAQPQQGTSVSQSAPAASAAQPAGSQPAATGVAPESAAASTAANPASAGAHEEIGAVGSAGAANVADAGAGAVDIPAERPASDASAPGDSNEQ